MNDDNFLSRWSRRKTQVREGVVSPEAVAPLAPRAPVSPMQGLVPPPTITPAELPDDEAAPPPAPTATEAEAPPTLADVAALTRESDYTRFVTSSVDPQVKNAALKKLFTDPHFNVMDGLDTYIDDYGKPDPLPPGMLRQMVQSKLLGLFSDEDDDADKAPPVSAAAAPPPEPPIDEDTDLRLQPHDASGRPGPAPGAGEDGGREH
jgi:Protein of unknown function (DUF3306)